MKRVQCRAPTQVPLPVHRIVATRNLPPTDVLAPGGEAQSLRSAGIEHLDPSLHSLAVQQFLGLLHPVVDLGIRVFAIGLVDALNRPLKSIGVTHAHRIQPSVRNA